MANDKSERYVPGAEDYRPSTSKFTKEWTTMTAMEWRMDVLSENRGKGVTTLGTLVLRGNFNGNLSVTIE